MKRKITEKKLAWKTADAGRTALLTFPDNAL